MRFDLHLVVQIVIVSSTKDQMHMHAKSIMFHSIYTLN